LYADFPAAVREEVQSRYNVALPPGPRVSDADATAIHRAANTRIGAFTGQVEFARRIHFEAMKKYLLPIDRRWLDDPVAAVVGEAWQKAWESLDEDGKLKMAKAAVETPKKTPQNLD
jgi:hypothetical protein